MLNPKVYHDSHNTYYRSPFGAVPCGTQMVFRLEIISQTRTGECLLRLWEKGAREHLIPMVCREESREDDETRQLFEVQYTLPEEPGLVWYFFRFTAGNRFYFYGNNREGLGGIGELSGAEPPSFQITVFQPSEVPRWFKEGVIYQIFVDRFFKGKEQETPDEGQEIIARKKGLLHLNWEDTPFYFKDDQGRVTRWTFFGGNLAGVMEKLDYLQELGITIIYFNPIFEAASSHKYDTADYLKIDAMFGDENIFRRLVQEAEKRGISIILDGVFSHTGCDSVYFNRFGRYPGPGAFQAPDSPYASWYTFREDGETYECWWGVDDLPNVNEMELSYRDFIYRSEDSVVRRWLRTGVKGWRLDVADELPDPFIKELRQAVKETDPEAVLIGEVWEDASNKISYGKLREYFWGEELDATMNYPWRAVFLDFFLGRIDARMAHRKMMSLYENYPRENFYAAMNLIGSHDRERILTLLGEAPEAESLTEKEKEHYRLAAPARGTGIKRLKLFTMLQMTFPGVPCVYYGDEAGMEGYADPYNRGPYPWGKEDKELLSWYKKMIRLRREYSLFQEGAFSSFYQGEDVYGFRLTGDGEEILVFVNRNLLEGRELNGEAGSRVGYPGKRLILDLLQGAVLKEGEKMAIPPLGGRVIYMKSLTEELPGGRQLVRRCGVLLHITSLPSPWGVGDMGEEAYKFVDFLAAAGQSVWQILPLHPPGLGNSPYQGYSAFAGNTLLLDIHHLVREGLLDLDQVNLELDGLEQDIPDRTRADFALAERSKTRLYRQAFCRFQDAMKDIREGKKPGKSGYLSPEDYRRFQQEHRFWLEDYCLYAALKELHGGAPWHLWEKNIRDKQEAVLDRYREELAEERNFHCFLQYTFLIQWQRLKHYANRQGILIFGDLPIYVAQDSCDTWVNRRLFSLDREGRPGQVAGVPPDYFSATGQLWGNPLYHWAEMKKEGYSWWVARVRHSLHMHDFIRLDHFRGFEAFWAVPGEAETAVHGLWLKGPGKRFFDALHQALGSLPFIAENLGVITPEVDSLKHIFGFPGMKVFQFSAREMTEEAAAPELLAGQETENLVYYTGTHDNDTLVGWRRQQPEGYSYREIMEKLYQSRAAWVIVPLQDILGLDSEARMNTPGTTYGNWAWRLDKNLLTEEITDWLKRMAQGFSFPHKPEVF